MLAALALVATGLALAVWLPSRRPHGVTIAPPPPDAAPQPAPAVCGSTTYTLKNATVCQHACEAGDADACNNAGAFYNPGNYGSIPGLPKDGKRALAYFDRACAKGSFEACDNQALMLDWDDSDKNNVVAATRLYERACEAGVVDACGGLALHLVTGRGVERDEKRGLALLQRACDDTSDYARDSNGTPKRAFFCWRLGGVWHRGFTGGAGVDLARADALYERACDLGQAEACWAAGNAYADGHGVKVDKERARTFYTKACKAGYTPGCDDMDKIPAAAK
jgi:TPR repeat protein